MRYLSIFLVFVLLVGLSGAAWYGLAPGNYKVPVTVQTIRGAGLQNSTEIWNTLSCNTTVAKTAAQIAAAKYNPVPDVPRCVTAAPGSAITGNVLINGTDFYGNVISEKLTWTTSDLGKSTGKAFKTVTSLNCTTGAANSFNLGYGQALGLNTPLASNTRVIMATLNGVKETTAPTVTASSTVIASNTIDLSSALNGNTITVWFY